jgi:cytochrome c oxidase cbb3-type subunit I/II
MAMLGVPYGDAVTHAEQMARAQAKDVAADIEKNGGPANLQDKDIVALIAYVQRLGQDIKLATPAPTGAAAAARPAKAVPVAAIAGKVP